MNKTQEKYWRWEKVIMVDELTIKGISFFDYDRNKIIIKPDEYTDQYVQGYIQTDQLHATRDKDLVIHQRFAPCFEDLQNRDVTLRSVELYLDEEGDAQDHDTWLHVSVVGRALGMDYEKSKFTIDEDDSSIKSIEKLVLNREHIERSGMHIFRLYEFQKWILVSDTLKQKLQALNINGMRFLPIEG